MKLTQPTGKRTVKYVAPGHTQVNYETRTLDIRFKESKKEYDAKLRRVHKGTFVERDATGIMRYVDGSGRDVSSRARTHAVKGRRAIQAKQLSKDSYTIEDMRALLRDEHWEEVSGNKRWNYDSKATVREFNKYLRSHRSY